MTLQSIYNNGKGNSAYGIVKAILEESYRDAGLHFLPTKKDVFEHMEKMEDYDRTLVTEISERIKQNIFTDIQRKLSAGNIENREPTFPNQNAGSAEFTTNYSEDSQPEEYNGWPMQSEMFSENAGSAEYTTNYCEDSQPEEYNGWLLKSLMVFDNEASEDEFTTDYCEDSQPEDYNGGPMQSEMVSENAGSAEFTTNYSEDSQPEDYNGKTTYLQFCAGLRVENQITKMSQSFKDHSHSLLPSIESSTGDESNSTRTEPLVKFCEPKSLSSKVLEKVFLEIENGSKPSVVADKYKIGYCTLWKLLKSRNLVSRDIFKSFMNQHKKTEREVIEDAYEELKNGSPLIKLSIDLGIPSSTLRSKIKCLESFAKDKQLKQENYKKAVLHVEWGTSLTKASLEKNVNRKILKKVQISNKLNAEMEVNNLLDLENEKSPKQKNELSKDYFAKQERSELALKDVIKGDTIAKACRNHNISRHILSLKVEKYRLFLAANSSQ